MSFVSKILGVVSDLQPNHGLPGDPFIPLPCSQTPGGLPHITKTVLRCCSAIGNMEPRSPEREPPSSNPVRPEYATKVCQTVSCF